MATPTTLFRIRGSAIYISFLGVCCVLYYIFSTQLQILIPGHFDTELGPLRLIQAFSNPFNTTKNVYKTSDIILSTRPLKKTDSKPLQRNVELHVTKFETAGFHISNHFDQLSHPEIKDSGNNESTPSARTEINVASRERKDASGLDNFGDTDLTSGLKAGFVNGLVESKYYEFVTPQQVYMWIDVPNTFPWRRCLRHWLDTIITYNCYLEGTDVSNLLWHIDPHSSGQKDGELFHKLRIRSNVNREQCLYPSDDDPTILLLAQCKEKKGYWVWRRDARMEFSDSGACMASQGGQEPLIMANCSREYEDQIVEVGIVTRVTSSGKGINATSSQNVTEPATVLQPIWPKLWEERQKTLRQQQLVEAKVEVDKVLQELVDWEMEGKLSSTQGSRRAVIFYLDKGDGFLSYLTWWLFAWHEIHLDSPREAFDIILMVHPSSVTKLPEECKEIPDDFDANAGGPGQCLYKPLVGISERDHRYDEYLNSQECLINPAAKFLEKYKLLMRADLDTFPTPRMLGYWPDQVICNKFAVTTHYLPSIEDAIKQTAKDAGIIHHGWHNTDSAWFGPAYRILGLAKLTTHLARYTRAHMFGPGTMCRCSSCSQLPRECEWGGGIYAGTLLLYAQEIAMNRLWTQRFHKTGLRMPPCGQPLSTFLLTLVPVISAEADLCDSIAWVHLVREFDEQTFAMLDSSCTDETISICRPALLHARHNSDPFSKYSFLRGEYTEFDMAKLDITNVRDYAMYMAIASHGQGVNQTLPKKMLEKNVGGGNPLWKLCSKKPRYMEKYPL